MVTEPSLEAWAAWMVAAGSVTSDPISSMDKNVQRKLYTVVPPFDRFIAQLFPNDKIFPCPKIAGKAPFFAPDS